MSSNRTAVLRRSAVEAHTPRPRRKSAPITEQSARPPPDDTIKPVPGTPDEYTIQKGDTLWDLSQKFLSNPWYWPKIWSLNPSIENPHWIYPGNKLRIVPGEGGARDLFAIAVREGAQVRHLRPSVPTLEDVFAKAVGED